VLHFIHLPGEDEPTEAASHERVRLLLATILIMTSSCGKPPPPAPTAAAADDAGAERLGPPQPGEWRARFHEREQTFEDYVETCANRRTPERSVFYLQPLGDAAGRYRATVERLRDYAAAFFNVPVKVCDPITLFEEGWVPQRRQYNSSALIAQLAGNVPADALVYVGLTEKDLFARGLNFVFGEGNLRNRCGIYSLTRYETDDESLFLRRAIKLMSHEVGHILSLEHCVTYRCVMQGANSIPEGDAQPAHLCPVDLRKLQWNAGFDVQERYRRLFKFYRDARLEDEAAWVERRLR
jgi:archaemetzincin